MIFELGMPYLSLASDIYGAVNYLFLATLSPKNITEGAGLFTYGRMLGTSIGVSLLSTLISRETQINWENIGQHISIFNNNLYTWLHSQHLTLQNSLAIIKLQSNLSSQANMIAFLDGYQLIAIVLLALIPIVLCLKDVKLTSTEVIIH